MVDKKESTDYRQKQIAVAAAKLIVKYGSEHVTIKRLASQTNLSEAAIYRHFDSKSDIFRFLLKRVENTLLSDLNPVNAKETTRLMDLDELIDRHISRIERNHGVSFQVIAEIISMGDKTLNRDTLRIINSYIDHLAQVFRRLNIREPDNSACLFFTLVQGLVNQWALSNYTFNLKNRFNCIWASYINPLGIK